MCVVIHLRWHFLRHAVFLRVCARATQVFAFSSELRSLDFVMQQPVAVHRSLPVIWGVKPVKKLSAFGGTKRSASSARRRARFAFRVSLINAIRCACSIGKWPAPLWILLLFCLRLKASTRFSAAACWSGGFCSSCLEGLSQASPAGADSATRWCSFRCKGSRSMSNYRQSARSIFGCRGLKLRVRLFRCHRLFETWCAPG